MHTGAKRDLSWLGSLSLSTSEKPSLRAMEFFMERLGHPERKLQFVHIAGTNGKGSVAEMMAKILEKAGYRTGKFMSPHLLRFNERIQVDGEEITDAEIEKILDELQPVVDEYEAKYRTAVTLFEIETTLAILYYAQKKCDIVVLEVGLGGKFDCTNIVTAAVSIIVSIGYDHMNILGESLAEIAEQKAGIIKDGGKVVCGELPEEAWMVVQERCGEVGAELHEVRSGEVEITSAGVRVFDKEFGELDVPLKGRKQAENVAICLESVRVLREEGWKISSEVVREGLGAVVHQGRFEQVSDEPIVVFDGAHNLPAIQNFWENVEAYYPHVGKRTLIVSILKKKDCRKILGALLRGGADYIFTTGDDAEIFTPAEELLEAAKEIYPEGKYRVMELREALERAKGEPQDGVTFVVGSFHVYGVVKEVFDER